MWEGARPGQCTVKTATKVGCKRKLVEFVKEYLITWIALGFAAAFSIQVEFSLDNAAIIHS